MKEQSNNNAFLKTDGGTTKTNAIEMPSISLPKGGGAIKGIDEKFSVNAVTGTAVFSIPLPFSKARGVSPELTLAYNSGSGNGIFGLGWSPDLSSIKRKTDKGLPQYNDAIDSDTFLFSGAEDLVPEFKKQMDGSFEPDGNGGYTIKENDAPDIDYLIRYYRPRTEGLFARIERWRHKTTGEIKWRITTRDNITTLYGWTGKARIINPQDDPSGAGIFEWLPEFVFDDKGNCAHYTYKKENKDGFSNMPLHQRNRMKNGDITYANTYIEKIYYGNKTPYRQFGDPFPGINDYLFFTLFDYGEYNPVSPFDKIKDWDLRADAFSNYRAGFEIRTTRLCRRVLLFHHFTGVNEYEGLVRSTDFEYDTAAQEGFTFLKSVTQKGYIKKQDGSYSVKALPAMEFSYQPHSWNSIVETIDINELVHAPVGINEPRYQFVDLYNEGLSGILAEQANGWYYKHNLGNGEFEQARLISPKPSFAGLGNTLQLADLDADGSKQLISLKNTPAGFFELDDEDNWQGFRSFDNLPNINFSDAYARMIDLDGDGRADLLITEDHVFTWYPSEGREGFNAARKTVKAFDEEEGPAIVFADKKQTVFLADMCGDGLTDIVRIRNGEICYWPNTGYGTFGTKITMDDAPVFDHPDAFNALYIRMGDIAGSGVSDIIYLGRDKFSCWKNLCGNRFSAVPFEIDPFPEIHAYTKITVADLLGNGMACIVWSSPLATAAMTPLKYINLTNSKKPYLMMGYKNNMGKEVSIEYTPSTHFYLEDKKAGRPWVTKLHFPVHCISKTLTEDKISGHRFVSEYKYHHGYYDHPEREFRGFGMVEQIDAETFEHWKKSGASNIVEEDLHQEPVVTRTWHHTGAFLGKDRILDQFKNDYWYSEMERQGFPVTHAETALQDARLVAAPGIINDLSGIEWQQALRACRGLALRTETFARDAVKNGNTPAARKKELTPFSATTHNCMIELLQPKGQNKYAVFVVKKSETVTYNYERNTEDPRVAHDLNIKLDEYGNVLETASVIYPRRVADLLLPAATQAAQNKTTITYTQNRFTNDVVTTTDYRLRLAAETKTYELTGVNKTAAYYTSGDFEDILSNAGSDEAFYHEIDKPPAGKAQRRLIEHTRSVYYGNNLNGALPLGQLESLAIPFESYQLAYTPELVMDVFGLKVSGPLLSEGKFTHSESDSNWWVRSGTRQLIIGAETAADAQDRFYVPVSFTDPYGATTKVKYYGTYFLMVQETEDALGNRAGVDAFNFRTMSPQRMKDANNNFSEAISDELGIIKAMAIMGKGTEADELTGLTEITGAAETLAINNFFNAADPIQLTTQGKSLLNRATMRFVYDLNAFAAGKPAVVASITREQHFTVNNNSPVQISFEYASGLGEVIMKKTQAAPGLAKEVIVHNDNTITINEVDTGAFNPKHLRWTGNGRTIKNNKGNTVKQYESYFSVTHRYENYKELVETGVTPVMYYDAMGRLIKTEMPDACFSKVEFDSWKQSMYDPNDNILESPWYINRSNRLIDAQLTAEGKDPVKEQQAANKAAMHAGTPNTRYLDTLGRPVLSVEHNKNRNTNADEFYHTHVHTDIEGNLRTVTDARGNITARYKYDMLGNMIYQNSMDAGQRWLLTNIMGGALRTWDERNYEFQYFYDILHRPVHSMILGGDGPVALNNIFSRTIYGEGLLLPNRTNEAAIQAKNVLGQVIQQYDTAGLADTPEFDFKGKPLHATRRLFSKYKEIVNWTDAHLVADLEASAFTVTTVTDAMGRTTRQIWPDGSIVIPSYNEAGLLNAENVLHPGDVAPTPYIKDIGYDEKGRREKIIYGNDVSTKCYYDKETFRLKRLESKRKNNDPLQDWRYTYDAAGNVTHIEDLNIPTRFFNNIKTTGVSEYTYDALYRLAEAKGRENNAALAFTAKDNWNDASFMQLMNPGDLMGIRSYTQTYWYDEVGNILNMEHAAPGNNWTRDYTYNAGNNRLIDTKIGGDTFSYTHHAQHGFITAMPHLEELGWNFKEELVKTIGQKRNDGGTPETIYYQYDGDGKRIRKITENTAGAGVLPSKKEERIYIGGYELYKKYSGAEAGLERVTLSLLDEGHRFVLVEMRNNIDDGTEKKLVRYQMHNHLGSAALELDDVAEVISYEEYHPYGTTAYQAKSNTIKAAAKRYRYTGMERDEESGLEYHSARYYLPWLGRWLSCDPLFKENRSANKKAGKEHEKKEDPPDHKSDDTANTGGDNLPGQHQKDNRGAEHPGEQPDQLPHQKNTKQTPQEEEALFNLDNLNLYAYGALNPIIYHDPSGNAAILQAWHGAYTNAGTAGKVGLGFAFIFVWLAHVIVNLLLLFLSVTILNYSGIFGIWDFSYGGIQSALGLGGGIIAIFLGAHVRSPTGHGARVELPGYMGSSSYSFGFSLGPVVFGSPGFSDWNHEFGHTMQSRVLGPLYLLVIALPSIINAGIHPDNQDDFYTESWANKWQPD